MDAAEVKGLGVRVAASRLDSLTSSVRKSPYVEMESGNVFLAMESSAYIWHAVAMSKTR